MRTSTRAGVLDLRRRQGDFPATMIILGKHTILRSACFCLAAAWVSTILASEAGESIAPTNRIDLFNGKDLTGWKLFLPNDGDVTKTWSVENGVIKNSGKPTGYMRTEQDYRDYKLTVEWRFVKVAPRADNSGILVHMQLPDKLWPPCVQCQGKHGRQGDLFLMAGAESKEHQGKDANTAVAMREPSNEKPVGEWDTVELVCSGNSVKAYVNGKLMNATTECTIASGRIGVQSEGGEIEIRKMFIEPLKAE